MTYGDHMLCNPVSMMGNLGFTMSPLNLRRVCEDWEVHVKFITKGENKARLNRFEPVREADVEWALNLMRKRVGVIQERVNERRGKELDLSKIIFGHEPAALDLVDQVVESPEVYLTEKYGKDVQIRMPKADWKQKLGIGAFDIESEPQTLVDFLEGRHDFRVEAQLPQGLI